MKPKHTNGKPDTRYTVTLEHTGHPVPQYVARWLGEFIGSASISREAWSLCTDHQRSRAA